MNELEFLNKLQSIATHPAARGLNDDAALLSIGRYRLVVTHDMLIEGTHFLTESDPADVAWKLVGVTLSDLAAKGAKPLGLLMGYTNCGNSAWNNRFIDGMAEAIAKYSVPLIGGDTATLEAGQKRSLSLTAIGEGRRLLTPARSGARDGDDLFVTGDIGNGWAGLMLSTHNLSDEQIKPFKTLMDAYKRPIARLDQGRILAPVVSAMMDISDGLLIDALRIARASDLTVRVSLDSLPLSPEFIELFDDGLDSRMDAATGGDDYELLFTAQPELILPASAVHIGDCVAGEPELQLFFKGERIPLGERLGYIHGE